MMRPKFKRGEYKIHEQFLNGDRIKRVIEGYIYESNPLLGYHQEDSGNLMGTYTVDHIPTGWKIRGGLSIPDARKLIVALSSLDWDFTYKTRNAACAKLAPKARQIFKEVLGE
jgi:hypothetical protein